MNINKCLMNLPSSMEDYKVDFTYTHTYTCKRCTQLRRVEDENLSFSGHSLAMRWQKYLARVNLEHESDIWADSLFNEIEQDDVTQFSINIRLRTISIVYDDTAEKDVDFLCEKCRG